MNAYNETRTGLYVFDWFVIGYSILMITTILIFGRPMTGYIDELVFYFGTATLAWVVARYIDERCSRWHTFIRLLYPIFMFAFFYRMTEGTIFLVFDHFFDYQLVAFEKMIFGVHPTLYIDKHLLNVVANEFFSLCYFLYYFMILIYMLIMFIRKDNAVIKSSITAISLCFFLSYLLFFLYPIEGPRWYFSGQYLHQIDSPVSRHLVNFIIQNGAVHGGCMPSSHIAVAMIIQIFCFRYYRRAAWWLLPIVTGLAIGTVWGRFHYVSDVVVGILIGAVSIFLTWKLFDKGNQSRSLQHLQKELETENVS